MWEFFILFFKFFWLFRLEVDWDIHFNHVELIGRPMKPNNIYNNYQFKIKNKLIIKLN